MTDIPFTTYTGSVRQFETRFPLPQIAVFYGLCFSLFEDIDRQHADDSQITYVVTAAGTQYNFGSRPRRFAGGPGLRPESYSTISTPTGDRGALRDELTAYYSGSAGIWVMIYDPTVEEWVTDHLREQGVPDVDLPLLYIVYKLEETMSADTLAKIHQVDPSFRIGEKLGMTYGVRQSDITLERVIDLRYPEAQEWFVETFVALEVEAASQQRGPVIYLNTGRPPSTFGEMLPVISSLETGGGMVFSQAVGAWLRAHGANGLIFPGARSNCHSVVDDGELVSSSGWNLVRYEGATAPVNNDLFGLMGQWQDPDHDHIRVRFAETGSARGSLSIRGAREFNLIDFELKRCHARGVRDDDDPAQHATGWRNALISETVNHMLDAEAEDGDIFDQEAGYVSILNFLENHWHAESPE
jgi:hypothetical protein